MIWEKNVVGQSTADFLFASAPVVILIYMMTKKNNVPSHIALPISALLVYGISLIYFSNDPNITNATIVNGLLTAWVPIFIIWGAILLFKTMEVTGAMNTVRSWLNGVSPNPVAQLMIIGWAFAFLIEGASGFGTPAALAAPILVGLGFQPLNVACLTLVMNSVPVTFGAVGTPTWFGLGQLKLPSDQLLQIGIDSAIIHSVAALVVPVMALGFVVGRKEIRANIVFIYLSILSCVVPYLLIAFFNYEFPSLIGGMIGLVVSVMLAHAGIGLAKGDGSHSPPATDWGTLLKAFFPLWGTVLVLVLTRVPFLGIKGLLTADSPAYTAALGSLGDFSVSAALVLKLTHIFGTASAWSFATLYIPAFIPFFVVSLATLVLFKMKWTTGAHLWTETSGRMVRPIFALLGALVMVKLMTVGGDKAMVIVIGQYFADLFGRSWQFFASYLGAIGAFFAGSNTVSNLMFAGIQKSIAETLGLDPTVIIAMQSVGGAMGNMVCINNIVAVCSLLGILNKEGFIITRTVVPMIVYGIVAGIMGFLLGA